MKTKLSFVPRSLLVFGLLALLSLVVSSAPLGMMPAARAQQGTPTAEGGIVIQAQDKPRASHPVGKQELRLAGTTLDPSPLDPAFARDVNSAFMTRQVFRGLMRF